MGKKTSRKKYVSSGKRSNVNHGLIQAVKADRPVIDKIGQKIEAWSKGLNPWITIANPTKATNKPFIRVRANDYYGDWKAPYQMHKDKADAGNNLL